MMRSKDNYIIPFVGLKIGKHEFEFDVDDSFFAEFDYAIVKKGQVKVNFQLEKKETLMIGDFNISGKVISPCDRCGDEVESEIEATYQLIYKFASEPEEDEHLVVVYPEEYEIDIKSSILEFISVSLPTRVVHPEGECNEEMQELMNTYLLVEENEEEEQEDEEVDPRWAALNKLK